MSDLLAGLAELSENAAAYVRADQYYTGEIDEVMSTDSALTRKLAQTGRRYRINMAKTPVNVVADRLEIAAVTVPGDEPTTKLLQTAVWDANGLLLESPGANRKACKYGDGYLFVWEGEQDGTVDVFFNSPVSMRLVYDPENPRRKLFAIKRWKQVDNRLRATLYYADRIERYVTRAATSGERDEDWEEFRESDGDQWPIPNPHGAVPVFHLRTDSPYGVPLHHDAYGPQDALNKLVITMMSATDYAGFPLRYALVDGDAAVNGNSPTQPVWGDDAEATESDQGKTELPTGPGHVWLAQGLKGVGQLDPADPKHFLDPAEFFIRAMAQVTNTPLHFFDPGGDQPSGESRRTAEGSMVKLIRYIQMRFASTWSEALSFALAILGKKGAKVDVRWSPAVSTDDKDAWETAQLKIDAGVPVRQVLLEQGYAVEQVDEWIRMNGEDNLKQRVALLAELGKAVQALGSGIALGAVSEESVQAAVSALLDPATTGEPAAELASAA
jgi:hypothetical protein